MKLTVCKLIFLAVLIAPPACADEETAKASPPPRLRIHGTRQIGTIEERKLDIRYPYFTGTPKETARAINRDIRNTINREIGPFVPQSEDLQYNCNYDVGLFDKNIISIRFEMDIPDAGAHQYHTIVRTYNCIIKNGKAKTATLANILGRKPNYKLIQKLCQKEANAEITISKLSNFHVNKTGISFSFDDLALGAATAARDIEIPYATAHTLFSSLSPVARYVQSPSAK